MWKRFNSISSEWNFSVLIFCIFAVFQMTFTAAPIDGRFDFATTFEHVVNKWMDCSNDSTAYAISIVKDNRVLFSGGLGYSTLQQSGKTRVTKDTKFAIGSLTKGFTSILVSKWVHENNNSEITLDTPIKSYYPDFELIDDYISKHATIADLLSHRVSAPGLFTPLIATFPANFTRDEALRRMKYYPAGKYSFREKLMYNNYLYPIPAFIMEKMNEGKTWEKLLTKQFLEPLGMESTGFTTKESDFSDFAVPFYYNENGDRVDISYKHFQSVRPFGPSGSIYSTAEDMTKWMKFILSNGVSKSGERLIDEKALKDVFVSRTATNLFNNEKAYPNDPISFTGQGYGLGWGVANYRGYRLYIHTGSIVTHFSRLLIFPDEGLGIYINGNGPQSPRQTFEKSISYYAADLALGLKPWIDPETVCGNPIFYFQKPQKETSKEKKEEEKSEGDGDGDSLATTDCFRLEDYIGSYNHKFFGPVYLFVDEKLSKLMIRMGTVGLFRLDGVNCTKTFKAYFSGETEYFNDPDGELYQPVNFLLNDQQDRIVGFKMGMFYGWATYMREFDQLQNTNGATLLNRLSFVSVFSFILVIYLVV